MTNAIRGEAALEVGGMRYRLLLTLGALAEMEEGLGLTNLAEIGPRLKQARAADIAIVASALLQGGGHDIAPDAVLKLPIDLGALMTAIATAFERAGMKGEGGNGPFVGTRSSPSG